MSQMLIQIWSARSGGVSSPRQAVFERSEVRILGYYTETVGSEKRSPPSGPNSFLGEGGYTPLFTHTYTYTHTHKHKLFVNPHVYQYGTVVLHHHSVSFVAEHVSENQEVELFSLFFFG